MSKHWDSFVSHCICKNEDSENYDEDEYNEICNICKNKLDEEVDELREESNTLDDIEMEEEFYNENSSKTIGQDVFQEVVGQAVLFFFGARTAFIRDRRFGDVERKIGDAVTVLVDTGPPAHDACTQQQKKKKVSPRSKTAREKVPPVIVVVTFDGQLTLDPEVAQHEMHHVGIVGEHFVLL
ncbi:hypothetical protein BDF21DRAFT_464680 [Thamnidium elegans]|nr:hypothetical protein BDF21DRAFT_464680 [Thamnidium elegans]